MKRYYILFILAMLSTAAALAAGPKLECEKLFTERYLKEPDADVSIITTQGNYFRKYAVSDNKRLISVIEQAVKADKEKSMNTVEKYEGGKLVKIILNIQRNNNMISIGFSRYDDEVSLFISGPPEAFQ